MGIYSLGFLLQPASAVLSFLKRVRRMSGAEADVERIMSCKVLLSHKHTGNLYGEGICLIPYIFIDDEKSSIEQAVRVVLDQENQSLLLGHLTKEDAGYITEEATGFFYRIYGCDGPSAKHYLPDCPDDFAKAEWLARKGLRFVDSAFVWIKGFRELTITCGLRPENYVAATIDVSMSNLDQFLVAYKPEQVRLIPYICVDEEKSSVEQAVRVVLDQENQSLLLGHLTKEDAGYVKQRIIGFLQPPRRVRLAANWPRGVFKYVLTVVAKVE